MALDGVSGKITTCGDKALVSLAERLKCVMYLLRHGQSYFNLHFTPTRIDPGIEDPELTELGLGQAEAAAARLADIPLTRIIISPYMRALQTAKYASGLHSPVTWAVIPTSWRQGSRIMSSSTCRRSGGPTPLRRWRRRRRERMISVT